LSVLFSFPVAAKPLACGVFLEPFFPISPKPFFTVQNPIWICFELWSFSSEHFARYRSFESEGHIHTYTHIPKFFQTGVLRLQLFFPKTLCFFFEDFQQEEASGVLLSSQAKDNQNSFGSPLRFASLEKPTENLQDCWSSKDNNSLALDL
jgi:hypothetical protein